MITTNSPHPILHHLAPSCNILQPCYLQGGLIGGAADFVQKICIEQFGIQDHITKK
jgi:hypothetical protein